MGGKLIKKNKNENNEHKKKGRKKAKNRQKWGKRYENRW